MLSDFIKRHLHKLWIKRGEISKQFSNMPIIKKKITDHIVKFWYFPPFLSV